MSLSNNAQNQEYRTISNGFCHIYNPLHFYSRIIELNIPSDEALKFAIFYEKTLYKPLMEYANSINGYPSMTKQSLTSIIQENSMR